MEADQTAAKGGFDLAQLDTVTLANEGVVCTIFDPATEDDTEIKITVLGEDSDVYQREQRRLSVKNVDAALKGKRDRAERIVDQGEEHLPKLLAACTLGWEGITRGGQPFLFSKANALWLYENVPVVREQVRDFVRERANFLKR
jgi:hypothetical protein